MRYPTELPLGQPFGSTEVNYTPFGMLGHNGQDFPVGIGTPVYAPEDGTVTVAANGTKDQYTGNNVAGKTIVLRGTYEHWLLHNSQLLVKPGQQVKEGQLIAYSGNTGFTTGPHCHWGVRPLQPNINNGYRGFIDPLSIMEETMELITKELLDIVYGAFFGRMPTDADYKNWVGKRELSNLLIQSERDIRRKDYYNTVQSAFRAKEASDADKNDARAYRAIRPVLEQLVNKI